jgi:hypothetical protein
MNTHHQKFMLRVLDMTLERFMDDEINEEKMLELFDNWCEYVNRHN